MRVPRWSELAVPRRVDLLIAASLLVWGLPDVPWWWEPPGHAGSALNVLGSLALTFAMSVPFCWRRSFPLPVLGAAAGVLALRGALSRDEISAFAAVLVAAYGLGAYGRTTRRYARWLGSVSLIAAVVVVVTNQGGYRLSGAPYALLGAAFVLGDAASARRGESSARLSESAAAVEAAHQAERTRIARELHDVVAHQLSAIAVQAGAARLAGAAQRASGSAGPPASSAVQQNPAEVMRAIEQLSREALTELNHLLGALRREPEADPDRRPTPTLSDLDALLDAGTAADPPVNLVIEGPAHPLSPGVELSAYRIIQEALANAARHAPAARVNVALRYGAAELGIEVTSEFPPQAGRAAGLPAGRPGGRGIRGMRERAELYGGHLDACAGADGGFTVSGVIPYDGSAPNGSAPGGRVSRADVPASGSR